MLSSLEEWALELNKHKMKMEFPKKLTSNKMTSNSMRNIFKI